MCPNCTPLFIVYWAQFHICFDNFWCKWPQWGQNLPLLYDHVLKYPERVQNLYFTILFVLRAVTKVPISSLLDTYSFRLHATVEDQTVRFLFCWKFVVDNDMIWNLSGSRLSWAGRVQYWQSWRRLENRISCEAIALQFQVKIRMSIAFWWSQTLARRKWSWAKARDSEAIQKH